MIRRAVALVALSMAVFASPAAAWDPEDDGWDWWWQPEPAPEPAPVWTPAEAPDPAPASTPEPAWTPDPEPWTPPDPTPAWTPPDPAPAWTPPDPSPVEPPAGLYYVTQTYVADVVTTQGPVTTYSTTTVDQSPGTYARVLESVGTGAGSGYDGAAFNGRAQLSDGRDVAGTFYQNFVLTTAGFVSVSIVFFQDDSETARSAPSSPAPQPSPSPAPASLPLASILPWLDNGAPPAAAAPAQAAPTQAAAPLGADGTDEPGVPTAAAPVSSPVIAGPTAATPAAPPHAPVLRGGVSPQPQGDPLTSIDVLRGRRIALWPRATVDGTPARVREWRASGELVALGPLSGSGGEPLVARWDALAAPAGSWQVRFALVVDLPGGDTSALEVAVSVVVRSPALVQ